MVLVLTVSGCQSGGAGPDEATLKQQAHHGIDITKMTPKEIASIPGPARDAIKQQLAQQQATK